MRYPRDKSPGVAVTTPGVATLSKEDHVAQDSDEDIAVVTIHDVEAARLLSNLDVTVAALRNIAAGCIAPDAGVEWAMRIASDALQRIGVES